MKGRWDSVNRKIICSNITNFNFRLKPNKMEPLKTAEMEYNERLTKMRKYERQLIYIIMCIRLLYSIINPEI